jgi:hypothetical protein
MDFTRGTIGEMQEIITSKTGDVALIGDAATVGGEITFRKG